MQTEPSSRPPSTEAVSELEKILNLAETLQESADRLESRIGLNKTISSALILAGFAMAAVSWLTLEDTRRHIYPIASVIIAMLLAVSTQSAIARLSKRKDRDQRALLRLVELLRETESIISEVNGWSPLERAQFQIRISRFDIGESAPSNSGGNSPQARTVGFSHSIEPREIPER